MSKANRILLERKRKAYIRSLPSEILLGCYGAIPETSITGALPLTFNGRASGSLSNYVINGIAAGAGIKTSNIFNYQATDTSNGYIENRRIVASTGITYAANTNAISEYISILPETQYTIKNVTVIGTSSIPAPGICFYDSEYTYISGTSYSRSAGVWVGDKTFTTPENAAYCRVNYSYESEEQAYLYHGSSDIDFEPFGYKIPLTNMSGQTSDDYNIFIGDAMLYEGEYASFSDQKIYKYVSSVLTPVDPPAPLPAIHIYAGTNVISLSSGSIGTVTITGKINEI